MQNQPIQKDHLISTRVPWSVDLFTVNVSPTWWPLTCKLMPLTCCKPLWQCWCLRELRQLEIAPSHFIWPSSAGQLTPLQKDMAWSAVNQGTGVDGTNTGPPIKQPNSLFDLVTPEWHIGTISNLVPLSALCRTTAFVCAFQNYYRSLLKIMMFYDVTALWFRSD